MTPTPLILAGGRSTRMRSPKHLLRMPDDRPLYQHQIDLLTRACPDAPTIYISLAHDSQLDDFLRSVPVANNAKPTTDPTTNQPLPPSHQPTASPPNNHSATKPKLMILHDTSPNPSPTRSAGPAAALLAAYFYSPSTTWLSIPCDHPFLTPHLLQHLCTHYRPPVTCFMNEEGFLEPLVAVWGPEALRLLSERSERAVKEGKGGGIGPAGVVRELGGRVIPVDEAGEGGEGRGLVGVNTPEEWEAVLRVLEKEGGGKV